MVRSVDFLVVGSGIAGLSFAMHASNYGRVLILTKKNDSESNTNYAQGGIACVLDPKDSFEEHIRDSLITGAGLCNKKAVEVLVTEGPEGIRKLLNWGVDFTKSSKSKAYNNLDLGREGGHTKNRIVHAKDLTGNELETAMLRQIKENKNISVLENHYAVELITNHNIKKNTKNNTCYGIYALNTINKKIYAISAKITFLATGGAGQVYLHTTNPKIATGDGISMAYRAGARISNMEFIQFHPTTLFHQDANSFLISEALRGYGAVLKDYKGTEFMKKYHKMGSLAPRDIVARAIDKEMKISGSQCVYLDIRHENSNKTKQHFPNIYAKCKEYGIDITKDLIPVVPAAHYMCGGIKVDINGNTNINNLYACGEVSNSGVHGANRLASNSLLEAIVFSKRSANDSAKKLKSISKIPVSQLPKWDDSGTIDTEEWVLLSHNIKELKSIMWDYVGIVRSNLRLSRAMRRIKLLEKETEDFYKRTRITPQLLELRNMVTVAKLIVISAQKRQESRGLHFTTDYLNTDDANWKHDTLIKRKVTK